MSNSTPSTRTEAAEPGGGPRGQWSRLGFILAASGSAIGLGNVVFFPANAYRFGAGGFYLPYLLALLVVGIPLMALELGLGHQQRRAYPLALRQVAGARGEFLGWWALANTGLITLYYMAILAWVMGMMWGSLGQLWQPASELQGFAAQSLANPGGYFFSLVSSPWPLVFVLVMWTLNGLTVSGGTRTIEKAVKLFVPMMWLLMLALMLRGLTLDGGIDGVWYLFQPDLRALGEAAVWQGALSQIFFSLSIGFGVMTTYGSYLPRRSDQPNNALVISCLNCSFEVVAGIAVFAILFVFAAVPQASTLTMSFFIVPQGIGQLPGGEPVVVAFGMLFFLLLLLAGLSSTVSLVESVVSALIDKLRWRRSRAVVLVCSVGTLGSLGFVLPHVVDPQLQNNGTLGLTLLDLVDHWALSYGLLVVGLCQCLLLGRLNRLKRLRQEMSGNSRWPLGPWYERLVGVVIPLLLAGILLWSLAGEVSSGLYGTSYAGSYLAAWQWLEAMPVSALVIWLLVPSSIAWLLTRLSQHQEQSP